MTEKAKVPANVACPPGTRPDAGRPIPYLDALYLEYGKVLVQAEVLQGRVNDIKKRIAQELNKPNGPAPKEESAPAKE